MNGELLALVQAVCRERELDPEIVFRGIEEGLVEAARRQLGLSEDAAIRVSVDRGSGDVRLSDSGGERGMLDLSRAAARGARQAILSKIREAETAAVRAAFEARQGTIVSGTIRGFDAAGILVSLGEVEGILPRREQIPGESYPLGGRLSALALEVRRGEGRLRITLSRTHPDLLRRLLELEVPEVKEGIVGVVAIARDPGVRAKIVVASKDPKVDAVGACIGPRGSRVKAIREALRGEQVDIVPHDPNPAVLVVSALKPAAPAKIVYYPARKRAKVHVSEGQLPVAIGKGGQNVRLASRVAGVEIDVGTAEEFERGAAAVRAVLERVEGLPPAARDAILHAGFTSLPELAEAEAAEFETLAGVEQRLAGAIREAARTVPARPAPPPRAT